MVSTYDKDAAVSFRLDCTINYKTILGKKIIDDEFCEGSLKGFLNESMEETFDLKSGPFRLNFTLHLGILFFTSIIGSTFNGVESSEEPDQTPPISICQYKWKENRDKTIEHRDSNKSLVRTYDYDKKNDLLSTAQYPSSERNQEASRLAPILIKASQRLISVFFFLRRAPSKRLNDLAVKKVESAIFSDICKQFAKTIVLICMESIFNGESTLSTFYSVEYKALSDQQEKKALMDKIKKYFSEVREPDSDEKPLELDLVVRRFFSDKLPDFSLPKDRKHRLFIIDFTSPFDKVVYGRFVEQMEYLKSKSLQVKVGVFVRKESEYNWTPVITALTENKKKEDNFEFVGA